MLRSCFEPIRNRSYDYLGTWTLWAAFMPPEVLVDRVLGYKASQTNQIRESSMPAASPSARPVTRLPFRDVVALYSQCIVPRLFHS